MPRQRPTLRGRLRQLAAAGAIAALSALAPAVAGGTAAASPASAQQVSVAITSISPQIAQPGKRITVSGTVSNPTGAVVSGLAVQLWSSTARFTTRSQLASYAAGQLQVDTPVTGAVAQLPGTLRPGQTRAWSVRVPTATFGFATGFGVYPLAAQLNSAGSPLADAYTFLPFWPGSARAAGLTRRERVAWIWPLIAQPELAACHSLLNDSLASSLASTGRLGGLLAAGTSPAGTAADLTWAIDPSLLSSAALMTHPYRVGGTPICTDTQTRPASAAARTWLASVRAMARQQDYFTTPYADVDVSALAHAGLDSDVARALGKGREVTASASMLGGVQRPAGARIDWPADGIGDYSVLGSLAANGIGTVVLNSSMMPPRQPTAVTPSAITTTPDGVNAGLRVALADSTLTQVLADAPTARHTSPAASFAAASFSTEQRFLAETAMIAAEQPGLPRSVVITPPRQWNPAPGLASALLAETDRAPWLRPASLSGLLAKHSTPGQVARKPPPPQQYGAGELHKSLLRKVRGLEAAIRVQADVLGQPDTRYLSGAVAAIESSAWRGDPDEAKRLLSWVSGFVAARSHLVHILQGGGQVTLTGKSGPVPVSIVNRLGQPVTVRLLVQAPADRLTILYKSVPITIGKFEQKTVAVKVRSSVAGSTNLKVSLLAPNGAPLPGPGAQITVDATHFGTEALVIIAVACGLFVVTSAVRAVRRGMLRNTPGQGATPADPGRSADETDTVNVKPAAADTHKEPDEYASAPGWVERP